MARSVCDSHGWPAFCASGASVGTSPTATRQARSYHECTGRSLFVPQGRSLALQILKNSLRRYIQNRISQRTKSMAAPCSKGS